MDVWLPPLPKRPKCLGGCALALALSAHNVPVKIYESRHPDSEVLKSGIILTPNGLWVLDRLGVFTRIKDRRCKSTHRTFKNDKDETIRKTLIANESVYGYTNHRIWRKVLLDEMRKMLAEKSIQINYDSKFNGIVSDTSGGVTFRINDDNKRASLLIGSDGIYSSVRNHIAPGIKPEYTGTVGVMAHIKRASVDWPCEDYERNATIQGKPVALFFIPEDPQAEDIMIGMQVQYPEQSRDDLEKLQGDHDKLVEFYRKGYDEWGPTARSIIDRVTENKETLYVWPYLKIPKLPRWYRGTGRVIILADGAHAMPPSSGQGVNQALEDTYSLTLLLTSDPRMNGARDGVSADRGKSDNTRLLKLLSLWQDMRQRRVDAIFEWATNATNVQRLPEAERKKLIAEGKVKEGKAGEGDDMSWLYRPKLEDEVMRLIDS